MADINNYTPRTGRVLNEASVPINVMDAGQPINSATKLITVTIPAGASQSAEFDCRGYRIARIGMPAAWTTAALTFLSASTSGGTFNPVYDDGGVECSIAVPLANQSIGISNLVLPLTGIQFLKLRSGVAATPVNQAADRVLTIVLAG